MLNLFHNNSDGTMRHPLSANKDGLVSVSDMTNIDALLLGYRFGLFPWHNQDQFGFFYYPHSRYVIKPSEIKIPKSIRSYFNKEKFKATFDNEFTTVVRSCKDITRKEGSTWITNYYVDSYTSLHQLGYAHCVEVWEDDRLVGGLYGVAIGKIFTGESMFSAVSNASRFAMIVLAKKLVEMDFEYIDCQVYNPYLESFGGQEMDSKLYYSILKKNLTYSDITGKWAL
jgi:leucyl/phenylalanyl-tRNA---protein transferase